MQKMWTYQVYVTTIVLYCAYVSSLAIDTETDTGNKYVKVNTGDKNEERDNQQSQNVSIVSTLPDIVNRINSLVNHSTGGEWVNAIDELIAQISERLQGQDSDQQVVLLDASAVASKHVTQEPQIALDVDDPVPQIRHPGKQPPNIEGHGPNVFNLRNTNPVQGNQHQNQNKFLKPNIPYHRRIIHHKFIPAGNGMIINALDKLGHGDDKLSHVSLQALHPMINLPEGKGDISGNKLSGLLHGLGVNMNLHPAQHGNRDIPKPLIPKPGLNGNLNGNPHRNPGKDHPHGGKHGIDIDQLTLNQLHSLLQYLRGLKESNGRATFEPKLHELCCIVG